MNIKSIKCFIVIFIISFCSSFSEESSSKLSVGADLVSRYVFRGVDYGNSPSIQPYISFNYSGFEIGYWGAISMSNYYKEVDLYLKYSIAGFTVSLSDYYVPSVTGEPASKDTRYFVFDNKMTAHTIEAGLEYQFPESFPLKVFGAVYFFGNDKYWGYNQEKDEIGENYYSSYFEIGYPLNISDIKLDFFLGLTPKAGAFGNSFGVVNLGITSKKNIKLSSEFELPLKSSLIFNPQESIVHFVFGVNL
ncbi:MAG TPA: hypothetical protein PKY56_12430 [Candidatus Kapabacteria bacterium]|nr:hypothetical protein [Candidatus Kapabacteria bacterium]HPO63477.1 hypothetical protein [Candidatus Kapabacteria bacterium]